MTNKQLPPGKRTAPHSHARKPPAPQTGTHPLERPTLRATLESPANASPAALLAAQRAYGNRAVNRAIQRAARAGTAPRHHPVDPAATPLQTDPALPANNTGLPDGLKTGLETLSGLSLDNVKVHYNSARPAPLHALAYAQGSDIYLAPGQERHLPHEAWHVVQQAQGRVPATLQLKDSRDD